MMHTIGSIVHAAVAADITLFKIINSHHAPFFDWFFWIITYLGNGWIVIPPFVALVLWKVPKSRRMRVLIGSAVVLSVTGLSNTAVKELVDRPRPLTYFVSSTTDSSAPAQRLYEVHVVKQKLYGHSVPSGHANTAFTLAALTVLVFGIRFWPAFLVALAVAYSRVYLGVHFPLDTLAGACLGIIMTLALWYSAVKDKTQGPSGKNRHSKRTHISLRDKT